MSRQPDFQKKEAKQSLWDMDGTHVKKRWRNKGKGRSKDKKLIKTAIKEMETGGEDTFAEEIEDALYCHFYGPCEKCIFDQEKHFLEEIKNT